MSNARDVASESEAQKLAWIEEHLAYELLMLRYVYRRLNEQQTQMEWNASFVAYAVYARNLYNFLRNEDTQNLKALDYVRNYKANVTDKSKGVFQRLRDQVFHLGKSRPTGKSDKKADLKDAEVALKWIEKHFADFIGRLNEPYSSRWKWQRAEPSNYIDVPGIWSTRSLPATIHTVVSGRKLD
jgi:hypothetical protein